MITVNLVSRFIPKNSTLLRLCSSKSTTPETNTTKPNENLPQKQENQQPTQYRQKPPTKEQLIWRRSWHEQHNKQFSLLRAFYNDTSNAPFLKNLTLDYEGLKDLWRTKKLEMTKSMQRYIPERNQMLGNELAAAHFLVHRGGAVKFHNDDKWIKANANNEYELPRVFEEDMYLQGLDCKGVELYYEGMVNFGNLRNVEWLSLNGCELLDDWALDRVGFLFGHSLIYLDIRNMPKITYRGIGALNKLENLKIINVSDNFFSSKEVELTLLMLQEINPMLDIRLETRDIFSTD